ERQQLPPAMTDIYRRALEFAPHDFERLNVDAALEHVMRRHRRRAGGKSEESRVFAAPCLPPWRGRRPAPRLSAPGYCRGLRAAPDSCQSVARRMLCRTAAP